MKILLKYPTRGRPALFFNTLDRYLTTAHVRPHVIVTVDANDSKMQARHQLIRDMGCELDVRKGTGKIAAINSAIPHYGWDILVLASDDHLPVRDGWDTIIGDAMRLHFPGTDGSFWFKDVRQDRINFMPIMGRKYVESLGWNIYHPSYVSLYCDDEQTAIGLRDKKLVKVPIELFRNESPQHGGSHKYDSLYTANNRYWKRDKENFEDRQRRGFPYP